MPTLSDTQIAKTLHPIKKNSTVWLWSTLSLSPSASCKFSFSFRSTRLLGSIIQISPSLRPLKL